MVLQLLGRTPEGLGSLGFLKTWFLGMISNFVVEIVLDVLEEPSYGTLSGAKQLLFGMKH